MKHKKYESIEGVWHKKEVDYIRDQGFTHPSIKWNVTEKVHGSNMGMFMNQDEFRVAKRNEFIKDGENFFQYLSMKESNGYKVRMVWDQLVNIGYKLDELIVYGELFGGDYPHLEVKKLPNVRRIQKGVYYSPNINFYCFDIMVNGRFLNMRIVEDVCSQCDILYAKILFEGTFDECMNYIDEFQTNIPKWLGLPLFDPNERHVVKRNVFAGIDDKTGEMLFEEKEIEYFGNICEGIVIKPTEPLYFHDDMSQGRVILKSKNPVFDERSKEKAKKMKIKHHELSEFAIDVLENITLYINENRLRNVLSKEGSFTKKDFGKILGLFKKDIYENYNMDHDDLSSLLKEDKKEVEKVVNKLCINIWRPIFLEESER